MAAFCPEAIRHDIKKWLDRLRIPEHEGCFAFCEKGSLLPSPPKGPLMPTVFAAKLAWQIGQWESWPHGLKAAIVDRIKQAQGVDGWFVDPWLAKQTSLSWKDWIKIGLGRERYAERRAHYRDWHARNIRAETRQNISCLLMVHEQPSFPLPLEVTDYDTMQRYLAQLDWRNPWGAGSHLSHQLMLSSCAAKLAPDRFDFAGIQKAVIDFLNTLYHPEDGAWYRDQGTSNPMKINGAMKILSGLQWIDFPEQDYSRLIDLVLSEPFHSDGCHFTNGLFVLHQILRRQTTPYRRDEINDRARKASIHLLRHKKEGAGFSFLESNSQRFYYTSRVSRGLNVADLHGSVMYAWACAIIVDILRGEYPDEAAIWKPLVP